MTLPSPPAPWTDWPARRMPGRAAFAAIVALGTTFAVASVDLPMAMIGLALLAAATAEILLPTTYTLSSDGVTAAHALSRRTVRWAQLRGWRRIDDGILLQGAGKIRFSRRRRSLILRCPGREAEVEAWLAEVARPSSAAA